MNDRVMQTAIDKCNSTERVMVPVAAMMQMSVLLVCYINENISRCLNSMLEF